MRTFKVKEPIEKSRLNDEVIKQQFLRPMFYKILNNMTVKTGSNASQTEGQEAYVELLAKQVELDPYSPYVYISKNFQTPKKYVKAELDWYKSMDRSIIGHEGIESNPTWQSCCTKDEKKEVAPAFTPVNEVKAEEPEVKAPEVVKPVNNYVEPESVFAQGLPEWSVEPPQVVVRRRKKI